MNILNGKKSYNLLSTSVSQALFYDIHMDSYLILKTTLLGKDYCCAHFIVRKLRLTGSM